VEGWQVCFFTWVISLSPFHQSPAFVSASPPTQAHGRLLSAQETPLPSARNPFPSSKLFSASEAPSFFFEQVADFYAIFPFTCLFRFARTTPPVRFFSSEPISAIGELWFFLEASDHALGSCFPWSLSPSNRCVPLPGETFSFVVKGEKLLFSSFEACIQHRLSRGVFLLDETRNLFGDCATAIPPSFRPTRTPMHHPTLPFLGEISPRPR